MASTVQEHTAKLWVLWHCWARIEDATIMGTSSLLHPHPNSAVLLDGQEVGGWVGWVGRRLTAASNSYCYDNECYDCLLPWESWLWEKGEEGIAGGLGTRTVGELPWVAKGPHVIGVVWVTPLTRL